MLEPGVGAPFGFENTFAMAVWGDDARDFNAQRRARRESLAAGRGYENTRRADGLPGLLKTYPLRPRARR
jgi:glycine betaine/choline ABC-type transport system substrate-binding protein